MRRFSITTSCAFALILSGASTLQASDTTLVSRGARVKVFPAQPGAKAITGNVADLAFDTLIVLPEGGGEALTFDPRDLRKIEVSQGKKGNALLGLAVGAGVGVGLGLAICSYDEWAGCRFEGNDLTGASVALAAAVFGGIGAGVGALIKTERWTDAQLPEPPPVALGVGKDGSVRLAFSLRL